MYYLKFVLYYDTISPIISFIMLCYNCIISEKCQSQQILRSQVTGTHHEELNAFKTGIMAWVKLAILSNNQTYWVDFSIFDRT